MSFRFWNNLSGNDGKRASFLEQGEGDSLYMEQFKALRAKFEYRVDMHNWKVVAVTSAIAGEGKTVSCVNLAKNLASSGRKKVLLIESRPNVLGKIKVRNLLKTFLHKMFGFPVSGIYHRQCIHFPKTGFWMCRRDHFS